MQSHLKSFVIMQIKSVDINEHPIARNLEREKKRSNLDDLAENTFFFIFSFQSRDADQWKMNATKTLETSSQIFLKDKFLSDEQNQFGSKRIPSFYANTNRVRERQDLQIGQLEFECTGI